MFENSPLKSTPHAPRRSLKRQAQGSAAIHVLSSTAVSAPPTPRASPSAASASKAAASAEWCRRRGEVGRAVRWRRVARSGKRREARAEAAHRADALDAATAAEAAAASKDAAAEAAATA